MVTHCSAEVMKNVRTVQYEELSEEQIKAARMRRSRDRCPQLGYMIEQAMTSLSVCRASL